MRGILDNSQIDGIFETCLMDQSCLGHIEAHGICISYSLVGNGRIKLKINGIVLKNDCIGYQKGFNQIVQSGISTG